MTRAYEVLYSNGKTKTIFANTNKEARVLAYIKNIKIVSCKRL